MYEGSIRFFAVKSLKMTFSNFFGAFSHKIKVFLSKSFALDIYVPFFHEKIILIALR